MKLDSINFERFKWFVNALFAFKKSSYPLTQLGAKLIIGTPLFSIVAKISFPKDFVISSLELSSGETSISLSLIGVAVGICLIYIEQSSNARKTAKALIIGLPGTNSHFPEEVLSKAELRNSRESVKLGVEEDVTCLEKQIERFNSEVCVDVFNRFIVHDKCKKLYIGGLARIPFLVAYGSLLRNLTAEAVYFDKFHRDGNWKVLSEENNNISLDYDELIKTPNISGDIGLAIGFSTPINKCQLPKSLEEHTTIIKPGNSTDRNLVKNQQNLEILSEEVRKIIDELSAVEDVKRVHLFISVQSSFAIEIGRRYQEGTHCNWVVHNFSFDEKKYNWAVEISKHGIKEFSVSDWTAELADVTG